MRSFVRSSGRGLLICGATALASCGHNDAVGTGNAGESDSSPEGSSGTSTSASSSGSGGAEAGFGGDAALEAGIDGAPPDPCGAALFCEKFDNYAGVTAIANKQQFGPWHAALATGASMDLDSVHKVSGDSALHVHIDNMVTAGGRLFSDGVQPIFASKPTHVYGRMMMYIDPNGTSIHWTFFGVNGDAEPSSLAVGRNAQYMLSSLPKKGVNTYSFVYGLAAMGGDGDGFHDCSSQSSTSMPSAWACISFEMDSVARKLRMFKDGVATPILSVDDHGNACVAPTSVGSPWYGPSITQLFVGAWSFHPMNAPLDVWIDDLVVDTKPVACPSP